jgi:hypothetical protein
MGRSGTSDLSRVIRLAFRDIFPRLALAALFASAAIFAYFEGVYLGDQARELHDLSISVWMWVFRVVTAICIMIAMFFATSAVKALLSR